MATARLAAAKRRAAVRSECDLRPTASGSRPCAAGIWIHPDPEAGCVRVYDRPEVAHQDPALPQSQAPQPVLCGTEGTGNRARLGLLCVPRLRAPALQTEAWRPRQRQGGRGTASRGGGDRQGRGGSEGDRNGERAAAAFALRCGRGGGQQAKTGLLLPLSLGAAGVAADIGTEATD